MLENIDDEIHIYHITMIEMLSDFQNKIKKIYLKDKKWKKIIQQLHYSEKSLADTSSYSYFMNENLIYYLNFVDTWWWFCVFKTLEKKIFKMTHDNYYHADFHQIYNNIIANLYIWNFSQCLKQYITHCLKYLHYQIVRHTSYKVLQLIIEFLILFYIIIVDFIFRFLKINSDLNAVIIIICKFFNITVIYYVKKVCKIEFINYFIENSVSKSIYIVVKYSFECW